MWGLKISRRFDLVPFWGKREKYNLLGKEAKRLLEYASKVDSKLDQDWPDLTNLALISINAERKAIHFALHWLCFFKWKMLFVCGVFYLISFAVLGFCGIYHALLGSETLEKLFPFFGYVWKDRSKMTTILSIHLILLGMGAFLLVLKALYFGGMFWGHV